MGRKKVTVHAPRNVDLPAHVVMIPTEPVPVSETKIQNSSRKKCVCLTSWLTGLILLCIGVVVLAHYLLLDSHPRQFQKLQADESGQGLCTDSTTTSLEEKIKKSDLIILAELSQKETGLFHIHLAQKSGLKGQSKGDFWLKVNVTDHCFESYSVASVSNSRQILFLTKVSAELDLYHPRFYPVPASSKLVKLMKKILASQPTAHPVVQGKKTFFFIQN